MRQDLEPRLLAYLHAELQCPSVGLAEPLTPLSGGFDTEIFAFRLSGAVPALSRPLILRVLGRHHDPLRALRERATQNAVADMGFPAPGVPLASADPEILGGAFLVMERRPGRPLLAARRLGIARLMVETHLRLHALDPAALLGALDREVPGSSALVSLDGLLLALYLRGYRRRRPLDASAFTYYEALACMRGLVRAAESRVAAAAPANPLDASRFGDRLAARFAELTGIRPVLEVNDG